MSETTKGKIVKRYSNILALSDAPRRGTVDVENSDESVIGGTTRSHNVSDPIAKRINTIYHKKPTTRGVGPASVGERKNSCDERHPLVLTHSGAGYKRGYSDTAAQSRVERSGSKRATRSVGGAGSGSDSGNVYIRLGGGQELVFNDDLDALELSPTVREPPDKPPEFKTASLPRGMQRQLEQEFYSGQRRAASVPLGVKEVVNHVNNQESASDDDYCDTASESEGEEDAHGVLRLDDQSCDMNHESSTDDAIPGDHRDPHRILSSDESALEGDNIQSRRQALYTSINNKRLTQSPSLKKIDRYRASLRRRKASQRSKSEPRIGEQSMYRSENDISVDIALDTESSDNKENEDMSTQVAVDRISRYDSVQTRKRLYEPHRGGRPTSSTAKISSITRSCSLSSLHRCNSLDDIPKGIAKSKILEIQKRVNDQTRRHNDSSRSPSTNHGSTGALQMQSPTPKTVISPGGRVTSPDQVTSPRNLVSQRVYPSQSKRSSTPMFFGGVPVTDASRGDTQGINNGDQSGTKLVPPPRRSRNRNMSKTVSSVVSKFNGAANMPAQDKSQYMNIGSVTKPTTDPPSQKKRPAPLPKPTTESESCDIGSSNEQQSIPSLPESSLKRPLESAVDRSSVKIFKRPSSVPPSLPDREKPCPPTIMPRKQKGLAPKAPIKMGVSSISPKPKKGPAPLPPGFPGQQGSTPTSTSTDDTSSSGDSTSLHSAEGVVAMETSTDSGTGSSSEHTDFLREPAPAPPIHQQVDNTILLNTVPPSYPTDIMLNEATHPNNTMTTNSNTMATVDDTIIATTATNVNTSIAPYDILANSNIKETADDHFPNGNEQTITNGNAQEESEEEYMDGDRPLRFTGLDLDDFAEMPVLILEGVTSGETCDFEESGETSDDIVETWETGDDVEESAGAGRNLNEGYRNKGDKESSSNESLNLSITSETDSSVTTVVEREPTSADSPDAEPTNFESLVGEMVGDAIDPTYIDMSRSSSMTDEVDEYVTMGNQGGYHGDNVANEENKVTNHDLNDNYMNGNVSAVTETPTTAETSILPVPSSFEDSSPDTSVAEAPSQFQDGETIYSTIERGVTLPRQISTDSQTNGQTALLKSDSGDTLDSVGGSSTDSGISGPWSGAGLTVEEDTDDTLVERRRSCSPDLSSSEDTLDDLDPPEDLYETIGNIQAVTREGLANRPRELELLVRQHDGRGPRDRLSVFEKPSPPVVDIPPTPRRASEQSPISPLSPLTGKLKSKTKTKKKNKKSRKKDRSPSPAKRDKTPTLDRGSSDDDLLNEKRKRAMSPGAVARDFVAKVLKVRPSSPKDKSEKVLSPLDGSGRKSPFSFKKVNTSPVITKKVTYLPPDFDGPPEAYRKQSNPAIFDNDISNQGRGRTQARGCPHCANGNCDHSNHAHHSNAGFNVNRYAGDSSATKTDKPNVPFRASKSMGDLCEVMGGKGAGIQTKVIHEDPGSIPDSSSGKQVTSPRRTLPLIPMKKAMPVLVKVIGKEDDLDCQHAACASADNRAAKVCHHADCTERNSQQPLMLCHSCDKLVHADSEFSGHLRFDVYRKGSLNRNSSLRSLPGFSQSEDEGGGHDNQGESKKSPKLKRKKGLDKRRYHTDAEHARQLQRSHSEQHHSSDDDYSEDEYTHTADVTPNSHDDIHRDSQKQETNGITHNDTADNNHDSRVILNGHQDTQQEVTQWHGDQSEDSLHFTYSSSSLENNSEESLSTVSRSSPLSSKDPSTASIQDHGQVFEEELERHAEGGDEVDGWGRSRPQAGGDRLPLVQEQHSSKKPDNSQKQTTPTTPKTPPHVPELLKKYSMGGEYFTLKLDVLNEPDIYEIVAAQKGVNLRDAVRTCLERRGINVNDVSIYLASSNTPLPLHADCYVLGGNHLHVKAKDVPEGSLGRSHRSPSTTSLVPNGGKQARPNTLKDKQPKPPTMYLRRSRQQRWSLVGGGGASPHHVLNPPVMHRRSSLKPRMPSSPGAVRTAADRHPLAGQLSPSSEEESEGDASSEESQRGKKSEDSGVSSDVSPAGTFTPSDTAKYKEQLKKSKSFFSPFGKGQQEKLDYLLQQLDSYSAHGLPPMPALLELGTTKYDDSLFELESHWSALVGVKPQDLSKKQKDQQEALWELVNTEIQYIRKLQVVIDLFYCCLMDLQNEGLLCEVRTEELFSNILDVCACSKAFWVNHMLRVVTHARQTRKLLDPSLLTEGFMRFDEMFQPYAKYCLEQKACSEYIKNNEQSNDLFKIFIQWAETQKQCKRLKLQDLVISPMQRLTKYKLLLIAILKKTEREAHRKDLKQMIEKVDRFVLQVNTVMHQRAEHERLSMIIDRIESYDVIDTANDEVRKLMGDFCKLDLTCPVPGCGPQQRRHLLLEGGLKFRENASSAKTDVYCFLFTDMLLITKPNRRGDKVKVTKPPMRLDKCVVHMLRDGVSLALLYLNEYHMATAVHTFHGEAAKVWVDHIKRAQEAYKQLRKSALEHSERRMYWEMFYEENYEDELAVINAQPRQRHPSGHHSDGPERQDSTGSLDSYSAGLGNSIDAAVSRSGSHAAFRGTRHTDAHDQDRSRGLRGSASLDENAMHREVARENVQRSDSEPTRAHTFSLPHHGGGELQLSDSSPNNSPATVRNSTEAKMEAKFKKLRNRAEARRTDSQSSGEGPRLARAHSGSRYKTLPHESVPEEGHVRNSRLNQRRISRDKRYYTADAIEDIRKDNRDASIQKRLSWNFGTVDINIDADNRQHYLKSKTVSSDSLRSAPSSSGVSSTGSLHLSPESEIYEESEDDEPDCALINAYVPPPSHHMPAARVPHVHFVEQHSDGSSTNESSVTLTEHMDGEDSDSDTQYRAATGAGGHHSKSMPDISHINVRDVREGVGSAEVGEGRGQEKKKLSHGELLRMKKQLLLNSTLEASEV